MYNDTVPWCHQQNEKTFLYLAMVLDLHKLILLSGELQNDIKSLFLTWLIPRNITALADKHTVFEGLSNKHP